MKVGSVGVVAVGVVAVGLIVGWGDTAWAADEAAETVETAEEPDADAPTFAPQYAVYGELGGAAVLYSANFEVRPIEVLSLRAGVSVVPLFFVGVMPLTVTGAAVLLGGDRHHFEFGANYVHGWIDDDDARFINPLIGYRYQPSDGGFLFRATLGPLVRANDPSDVLPWAGLSFGGAGML